MAGSHVAPDGRIETAVSDAVSRVYLDKFGKGPLHAESFINGDIVTTVMRDVLTVAERELIAAGRSDSVLTTRVLLQHVTDTAFKAAIGAVTGRRVLTVVSGFALAEDVATAVSFLERREASG